MSEFYDEFGVREHTRNRTGTKKNNATDDVTTGDADGTDTVNNTEDKGVTNEMLMQYMMRVDDRLSQLEGNGRKNNTVSNRNDDVVQVQSPHQEDPGSNNDQGDTDDEDFSNPRDPTDYHNGVVGYKNGRRLTNAEANFRQVLLSLDISWKTVNALFAQGWASMNAIRGRNPDDLRSFYATFNKNNSWDCALTEVNFHHIKLLINWINFRVKLGKRIGPTAWLNSTDPLNRTLERTLYEQQQKEVNKTGQQPKPPPLMKLASIQEDFPKFDRALRAYFGAVRGRTGAPLLYVLRTDS